MVNFVANPEIVSNLSDQFTPYEAYGVNWSRPYNGTLFRLPLRTTSQANTSLLSKRTISPDDAEALLLSLQKEASAMLLFLKSVERIEIRLWTSSSAASSPEMLYSYHISNMTPVLERYRSFVGDAVRSSNHSASATLSGKPSASTTSSTTTRGASSSHDRAEIADYTLKIQCQQFDQSDGPNEEIWEVCNQLGGGGCSRIAQDPNNSLLRLVPWGGVAAFVQSSSLTSAHNNQALSSHQSGGLAYCFLPLPVQTGLPVMVNGFFELSSNRRDVWQAGVDMEGDGRTRAEWNISLMRDIISPSYVRLLLRLRKPLGFTEHFQSLWPSSSLPAPWSTVSITTLNSVRTERLLKRYQPIDQQTATMTMLLSPQPNPQKKSQEISFFSRKSQAAPSTTTPTLVETVDDLWIECRHAVLLPEVNTLINEEELAILRHTLISTDHPVVVCSESFQQNMIQSKTCELVATPNFTRRALHIKDSTAIADQYLPPISHCKFLLKYCLSDIRKSDPTMELNLLPLLPLANDQVGILRMVSQRTYEKTLELSAMGFSLSQSRYALAHTNNDVGQACELLTESNLKSLPANDSTSSASILIVCSEELQQIFRTASKTLLYTSLLGVSEVEFLTSKEMEMYSNIRPFSASLISDLFRQILPAECFQNSAVPLESLHETVRTFLKEFWPYASLHPDLIYAAVEGAAIVPTRDGLLLPLSRLSKIISEQRADVMVPPNILDIIEKLGGHVLDHSFISSANMPQIFWDYISSSSRSGVLTILDALTRQKNFSKSKLDNFQSLSSSQRLELFSYLASCELVTSLTGLLCPLDPSASLDMFSSKRGQNYQTVAYLST
jgi:hypothetical protein